MLWRHAQEQYLSLRQQIEPNGATLIAVSKTWPIEAIEAVYEAGCRDFGENKVQELVEKQSALPADIRWHLIGHLQRNKVKYIAPFVHLIHSVDSKELLLEIQKQALKNNKIQKVLLQAFIAAEETKFGMDFIELENLIADQAFWDALPNIQVEGLMGMASFTDNQNQIIEEFTALKGRFLSFKSEYITPKFTWKTLSLGMSSDWALALNCGSNMVRIGSSIFGKRN